MPSKIAEAIGTVRLQTAVFWLAQFVFTIFGGIACTFLWWIFVELRDQHALMAKTETRVTSNAERIDRQGRAVEALQNSDDIQNVAIARHDATIQILLKKKLGL